MQFNTELRRLVYQIDHDRSEYNMAKNFADDYTSEGRNWRQIQMFAFRNMLRTSDRIVELVTEFFNNRGQ